MLFCHCPIISKIKIILKINVLLSGTGLCLAALGPGVHSASNKWVPEAKNNVSGEYSAAGALGWQTYRRLSADCLDNVGSLTSHNPIGLQGLLWG
jgi:hypothetical protein